MDSASEDLYLQKIEEFVHDEDKIVTFKWLSANLSISASDSKRLLQQYVTDQRGLKPDALAATYSLSGILEDDAVVVTVVKEEELEDKKNLFETVLNQEIYSVQKSKDIDLNAVSLIDYFDMHNPRDSPVIDSVRSKNSVKRVFKAKKALPPPRQPEIKGKMSMFTKIPAKGTEKTETAFTSPKQRSSSKETATKPKQNGVGIATFFNKNASKANTKPITQEKPVNRESITLEEKPVVKEEVTITKSAADRFKHLIDSDSETEESSVQQSQNSQSVKSKENQKPKQSTKRQRKDNKKNAPNPKRRKRIVEQEESDDDIFGSDDDENVHVTVVEDSEDDSEPVLKPKPLAPKNKKRKLIDRTFTDDDGYIITRKEWVEESPSEDEKEESKSEADACKSETELIKSQLGAPKPELKRQEMTDEAKDANENKKSRKSAHDTSTEKVVNGKAKGSKGKKGVPTNQPTLMNFFKKN